MEGKSVRFEEGDENRLTHRKLMDDGGLEGVQEDLSFCVLYPKLLSNLVDGC